MDPITGSALIGAGSSLIGGFGSAKGAKSANNANIKLARQQMAWQERMSNTAHQREVLDLRAAGLNPILSGTGVWGIKPPKHTGAPQQNEAQAGISTALEALKTVTDSYLVREQTELTKAQQPKIQSETKLLQNQIPKTQAETKLIGEQTATAKDQQNLLKAQRTNTLQDTITKADFSQLLRSQNISEQSKNKLLGMNVAQAKETLAGMVLEGEIDRTTYGNVMRHVDRFFKALPFSGSATRHFK